MPLFQGSIDHFDSVREGQWFNDYFVPDLKKRLMKSLNYDKCFFKGELDQSGRYCGARETVQVPPLQKQEPQVI